MILTVGTDNILSLDQQSQRTSQKNMTTNPSSFNSNSPKHDSKGTSIEMKSPYAMSSLKLTEPHTGKHSHTHNGSSSMTAL
jgi:hypothetical protein